MQRLKIILLALCIFVSGILAGAFGMRVFVQRAARDVMAGNSAFAERLVLSRLDDALDLTGEQKERIRPIVAETALELGRIRTRVKPEVDAAVEKAAIRMEKELTAGQREKLEKLLVSFKDFRQTDATPSR